MPNDDLLERVENEIRRRLSEEPCSECGRGAEAHNVAATALSQLAIGLSRLEIARQKQEVQEREETMVNPLALAETIGKLPPDNPTRQSMLVTLETQHLELEQVLRRLRGEEEAEEEAVLDELHSESVGVVPDSMP